MPAPPAWWGRRDRDSGPVTRPRRTAFMHVTRGADSTGSWEAGSGLRLGRAWTVSFWSGPAALLGAARRRGVQVPSSTVSWLSLNSKPAGCAGGRRAASCTATPSRAGSAGSAAESQIPARELTLPRLRFKFRVTPGPVTVTPSHRDVQAGPGLGRLSCHSRAAWEAGPGPGWAVSFRIGPPCWASVGEFTFQVPSSTVSWPCSLKTVSGDQALPGPGGRAHHSGVSCGVTGYQSLAVGGSVSSSRP
jgi:hypothetical protein